jgi:hypothetical protein
VAGTCQLRDHHCQPDTGGQWPLASAIVLSLIFHTVLLALGFRGQEGPASNYRLGAVGQRPLLYVTLTHSRPLERAVGVDDSPASAAEMLQVVPEPVTSPRPEHGAIPKNEDADLTEQRTPSSALGKTQLEGYLPPSRQTVPPKPLQDIRIPWPPGLPTPGKRSAFFTVFIDETGVVREMVADGPTLTPTMEEETRRVFMNSRFSPGQAGGVSVKSMLRIEVVFELELSPSEETVPTNSGKIVEQKVL